jgi:chromosome segregation ATPase
MLVAALFSRRYSLNAFCRSALKSGEDYSRLEQSYKLLKEEFDALKAAHASKLEGYSHLESLLSTQNIQLRNLESERDKLRDKIAKMLADYEISEKSRKLLQQENQDIKDKQSSVEEANQQLKQLNDDLRTEQLPLKQNIEQLRAENKQANDRINELLRRITSDSESTKVALEKSITSSVRLCVVAPTVNVHIPTGKMNLKSRY